MEVLFSALTELSDIKTLGAKGVIISQPIDIELRPCLRSLLKKDISRRLNFISLCSRLLAVHTYQDLRRLSSICLKKGLGYPIMYTTPRFSHSLGILLTPQKTAGLQTFHSNFSWQERQKALFDQPEERLFRRFRMNSPLIRSCYTSTRTRVQLKRASPHPTYRQDLEGWLFVTAGRSAVGPSVWNTGGFLWGMTREQGSAALLRAWLPSGIPELLVLRAKSAGGPFVRRWGWGKDGSGGVFSKASSVTELGWTKVAAIE
ncbi:unnamed protein product [Cochlearia groenlandica]